MIKIFLLQGAVEIIDERSGSSGFSLNCHGPHRHALHQEVSMEKSAPVFRRKTEPFIPAHDTFPGFMGEEKYGGKKGCDTVLTILCTFLIINNKDISYSIPKDRSSLIRTQLVPLDGIQEQKRMNDVGFSDRNQSLL